LLPLSLFFFFLRPKKREKTGGEACILRVFHLFLLRHFFLLLFQIFFPLPCSNPAEKTVLKQTQVQVIPPPPMKFFSFPFLPTISIFSYGRNFNRCGQQSLLFVFPLPPPTGRRYARLTVKGRHFRTGKRGPAFVPPPSQGRNTLFPFFFPPSSYPS